MKKFAAGLVKKRGSEDANSSRPNSTPEDNASRSVRLFCESSSPNNSNAETQEYLHLPTIVESAESSPAAAKAAAYQIRKLLKDNYQKPYIQYNAIMLIRILADNPGPSFTKNIDEKFRQAVQNLLQQGRDPSVQQILAETLQALETEKAHDGNLTPLMTMWRRERSALSQRQNASIPPGWQVAPPHQSRPRQQGLRSSRHLPPPAELAARIEEGRMSAQLLTQVTQSTPALDILESELAREFAERCQNAQRNLQGYMSCTDPAPDEQTFQTLIETCDALNVAMSKHQRSILAARRVATSPPPAGENTNSSSMPPPQVPIQAQPRAVPTATAVPQPSSVSRNPYYTTNGLQPTTLHSPEPERPVAKRPINPFSDENQISSRAVSDQQVPTSTQPVSVHNQQHPSVTAPASGTVELPLSRTPPLGPTSRGPLSSVPASSLQNYDSFDPPPGPPPNKEATWPLSTQTGERSARPPTQDSDDLYSTNSPVTPEKRTSLSNAANSPTRGEAMYPSQPTQVHWSGENSTWSGGAAPVAQTYASSSIYQRQYANETQRPQGTASTNPFVLSEPIYAADARQPQSTPINQPQLSPRHSPPAPSPPKLQPAPFLAHSTPSYVRRQDAAVHDLAMSGGSSSPPTPATDSSLAASASLTASGSATARIKDDEPMTPMSPEAWQSGRY